MSLNSHSLLRLKYFSNPLNILRYLKFQLAPQKTLVKYKELVHYIIEKQGLEIGGPSQLFSKNGLLPIYPIAAKIDGCNFAVETLWEQNLQMGKDYRYGSVSLGTQYISEATELSNNPSESYDFVISSHCLEHIANPLKAISEWIRVLKPKGLLLIVVPNKTSCFDHKRLDTPFEHLLEDYNNEIDESDLTHLAEILETHDLSMDKAAGSFEAFKTRSENNIKHRALHHHVFSETVLVQCLSHFGISAKVESSDEHICIYGIKSPPTKPQP